jgi:hypothetical protein
VLSDLHLNLTYDYTCGFPFCNDLGKYQLDSSLPLVETLLDDMKDQFDSGNENIDAILVQGDSIVHGLTTYSTATNYWPQEKEVLSTLVTALKTRFPSTPLIFGIGNNDVL